MTVNIRARFFFLHCNCGNSSSVSCWNSLNVRSMLQCRIDKKKQKKKTEVICARSNFRWGQRLRRVLPLGPKDKNVNSLNSGAVQELDIFQLHVFRHWVWESKNKEGCGPLTATAGEKPLQNSHTISPVQRDNSYFVLGSLIHTGAI